MLAKHRKHANEIPRWLELSEGVMAKGVQKPARALDTGAQDLCMEPNNRFGSEGNDFPNLLI